MVNIGYGLVALTVAGGVAAGQFLPTRAGFMWTRTAGGSLTPAEVLRLTRAAGEHADVPDGVDGYDNEALISWLRLLAPDVTRTVCSTADGPAEHLFAAGEGQWARVSGKTVVHRGDVWARVSEAHRLWCAAGNPSVDLLHLTVDSVGVHTLRVTGQPHIAIVLG